MPLRPQRSQLTPSPRVQLLPRPSRGWRNRTDSSHRFNSDCILQSIRVTDASQYSLPPPSRPTLRSQEVTEKSERIAQLEKEKSALIKQLFEARARSTQDTSTLDSTFIWETTSTRRNRQRCSKDWSRSVYPHLCQRCTFSHDTPVLQQHATTPPQNCTCTTPMRRTWLDLGDRTLCICLFLW